MVKQHCDIWVGNYLIMKSRVHEGFRCLNEIDGNKMSGVCDTPMQAYEICMHLIEKANKQPAEPKGAALIGVTAPREIK